MSYFHWIAGCALGLAWLWRLADAAVGVPKIVDISRTEWDRKPLGNPRVSVIVPACNEGADIEATLTRLLALEYDNYEVIAVDDRSTDNTGEIMDRIAALAPPDRPPARLKIIHIADLPAGWMGKPHAMWSASNLATGDWLLFTDADVLFKPDAVRRALAYAESEHADHVVVLPRIIMRHPSEKMMVAFFQTLFVFGHRPWKVADPKTKDHMGVGAFNMIRRTVYDALGTYQALRFDVLDDMKLGKVVKSGGYAQRNVFGADLVSVRWAKSAWGVVDNLTKNFFALMSFQWPRALASCFVLAFLNLMPFAGVWLADGWARLGYAVALFSMFSIYVGMSRKSDIPPYYFVLHPVSTALFVYTMLRSTFLTLARGGVVWRGTFYPLDELRKEMV
jgi:cellulose synthase/poly-beta-1,6-N-acetylglucosamine synthase-like glycosyltransferase